MKFDSVIYFVTDINEAANWYASFLNADVKYENKFYAYIDLGYGKIGFHPSDEKSSSTAKGQTVYWSVPNLNEVIKVMEINGAILYRGPLKTDLGEYACIMQDPFGNSVGLISEKDRQSQKVQ